MPSVTVSFSFCYGHRLMNYKGKCSRIHGHNAKLKIKLRRKELDKQGFVVDFSKAKKIVNEVLDTYYDHYLILQDSDPFINALESEGEDYKTIGAPPTAENIAKWIFNTLFILSTQDQFGEGVEVVSVKLWETDNCMAEA